jgi:hypothetical protein
MPGSTIAVIVLPPSVLIGVLIGVPFSSGTHDDSNGARQECRDRERVVIRHERHSGWRDGDVLEPQFTLSVAARCKKYSPRIREVRTQAAPIRAGAVGSTAERKPAGVHSSFRCVCLI